MGGVEENTAAGLDKGKGKAPQAPVQEQVEDDDSSDDSGAEEPEVCFLPASHLADIADMGATGRRYALLRSRGETMRY
jgi:hypothetical protein